MHFAGGVAYHPAHGGIPRIPYLTHVSDDDWAFLAPFLTLMWKRVLPVLGLG